MNSLRPVHGLRAGGGAPWPTHSVPPRRRDSGRLRRVGCGQAQTQVCDARADLSKQVDKLASLTPTTATVDAVSGALDAIKNDLKQISDAQGDLNDERKQDVESANQQFSAQLEAVAADLGSNLSRDGAKAAVQSAGKDLASSYQQAFASIECE